MDKVRRAEYKRKRWYKRRASRRHPLERIIKDFYANFRDTIAPVFPPLLAQLQRGMAADDIIVRGGNGGVYWDVTVEGSPFGARQTTRATEYADGPNARPPEKRSAVPVNYAETPRGPFYRDPFRADS